MRASGGKISNIERIPVSMLDANEIIQAIEQANGNVIVLIRGGGEHTQFSVFDDPRLILTLAKKEAYRIVGLGHSANTPLLHLVADHAAETPSAAGAYVSEQIAVFDAAKEEKFLAKQEIEKLLQDSGRMKEQLKQAGIVIGSH